MTLEEIKVILIMFLMVLLPGWAILTQSGYWQKWEPLQRWFLAACLGVSIWPILYYTTRTLLPSLRIGDTKLFLLLVICAAIIAWRLRKNWRDLFTLGKWGWLVLAILGLTLLTRLYIASQYPYLAGDDALHHVLLTEATSTTGILPFSLGPYGYTSLDHYHLGFYALTATLKLLAGVASDQAVLWMSQFLSGICGIGVFLVLDRKMSRPAAIIGMLAAGLLSPYPSWFVNWSRFTQLTAQTVLLPAALVLWDAISTTDDEGSFLRRIFRSPISEAVLLIAGVCLTHFRVAAFLLPLIIMICVYELLIRQKSRSERKLVFSKTVAIGLLVILLILPALLPGLRAYFDVRVSETGVEQPDKRLDDVAYYSTGDPNTISVFYDSGWLLIIMTIGSLLALFRSKTRLLGIFNSLWVAFLIFAAYAYKLNIYVLAFTNITAVVLAFYMPISIGAGLLFESLFSLVSEEASAKVQNLTMVLAIVAALIFAPIRVRDFEPHRAFMTKEDQAAMDWIKTNIPESAIFAVNFNFLSPTTPYGTDAGYWLPYYADRPTSTLTLISGLDEEDLSYSARAWQSRTLYEIPVDFQRLCANSFTHLYSGVKQPLGSPDLSDYVAGFSQANLIYNQDGVEIYQICGK